jgi:hypothetical protein
MQQTEEDEIAGKSEPQRIPASLHWAGITDRLRGRFSFLTIRVFGGQIFVPRQQLLVHRPRDVGQER